MASSSSVAILVLVVSCMSVVCSARGPKKIVVGDRQTWEFGIDYSDWALKNGPFYVNDVLVFRYPAPNGFGSPHSVYLLPNSESFSNCDFSKAREVANTSQGEGDGFEFVLEQSKTYYFACGERNGLHCVDGNMKFSVLPKAY
ncbi:hypothetical protein SDJN03_02443, partial [Cucurbita argyrosperma subsp. sororia]